MPKPPPYDPLDRRVGELALRLALAQDKERLQADLRDLFAARRRDYRRARARSIERGRWAFVRWSPTLAADFWQQVSAIYAPRIRATTAELRSVKKALRVGTAATLTKA